MTITLNKITSTIVLELAEKLSFTDLRWLRDQLDRLLEEHISEDEQVKEEPLPEQATIDEAIELYLADQCSLGRAAELAGVTRWEIQDILKERGIPIMIYSGRTAEEMDQLVNELEQEGLLC